MKVVTDNKHYNDIADAIREKTGTENTYTPAEMANGVNEVYEAGKAKEWNDFWDNYLEAYYSQSQNASYMFATKMWNDKTFKPNRDIVLYGYRNSNRMFYNTGITDLEAALQKQGVILDASQTRRADEMFYTSSITVVPELDLSEIGNGNTNHLNGLFGSCHDLHTVRKLKISDKYVVTIGTAFSGCTSLANIEFEGTIQTNASFSVCPLTVASLKSIITHLKDYSGTTSEYTYTVTFKTSAFAELEAEGATAEYNGTPCTWAELIGFLKWNLVKA